MRKFSLLVFLISIFIICLFGGMFLAKQVLDNPNTGLPGKIQLNNFESTNQMKLIVFFVDEIDQKKPNLIAVWGVNLYYQNPNQITFILLTHNGQESFKKLSRHFSSNGQYGVDTNTIRAYEKHFSTTWDGNIIIDNNAVNYFLAWLTENQLTTQPIENKDNYDVQKVTQFCEFLNNKTTNHVNEFDWQNISGKDFLTSLSVDDFFMALQTIKGEKPPNCEIILTQP